MRRNKEKRERESKRKNNNSNKIQKEIKSNIGNSERVR